MVEAIRPTLVQYGQEHVLQFWDELSPSGREQLAKQLEQVNFPLLHRLKTSGKAAENWAEIAGQADSPPAIRLGEAHAEYSAEQALQAGREALSAGQIGVVLVAGGQGTRLGFDHPKGMFPVGPVSGSTLFRILFEKVLACQRRYGATIPLYLMTSPATHDETAAYLAEQNYFGLAEQNVRLFCQGTMPAVDAASGKLLLAEKDSLALSPDGHGGMLEAKVRSGCLQDLGRRGIEHLFYMQVDNPLVRVCDPTFLGYHLLSRSELSTQVANKETPRDKVGNVVSIGGRLQIIEYSDLNPLPDSIVLKTDAAGQPIFWAGNTAVHAISVDFLRRMAESETALPFHVAHKKVPYVNEVGQRVEPEEPNATKFERFIFDLLPAAQRAMVVEIDAKAEFQPVKNAPGEAKDTPESVQAAMLQLHQGWLAAAGARLADGITVEIDPLFALDAEQTAERIPPGTRIDQTTFWEG